MAGIEVQGFFNDLKCIAGINRYFVFGVHVLNKVDYLHALC